MRLGFLILPVILLGLGVFVWFHAWFGMTQMDARDFPVERPAAQLIDPTNILKEEELVPLEQNLTELNQKYQMDFSIVIAPQVASDKMQTVASELFEMWDVGQRGMGTTHGMLLLIAVDQNESTIVLGPNVKKRFNERPLYQVTQLTDFLVTQHMPFYLKQRKVALGIEQLIMMLDTSLAGLQTTTAH